jgi:hypothetical protein
MKVLRLPIEMISLTTETGQIAPIKFRYRDGRQTKTIKVDRVLERDEEQKAGIKIVLFRCQSVIGGEERIFELIYEILSCKWYLYKM